MSQIVKCDICGGIYSQSHLSSHKRLSHGRRGALAPTKSGAQSPEVILSLYAQLPEEDKRQVRDRLMAVDRARI
jgi:hypothetical protein